MSRGLGDVYKRQLLGREVSVKKGETEGERMSERVEGEQQRRGRSRRRRMKHEEGEVKIYTTYRPPLLLVLYDY